MPAAVLSRCSVPEPGHDDPDAFREVISAAGASHPDNHRSESAALNASSPTSDLASGESSAQPGLWLTLEKLRELPLTAEARLQLLEELVASPPDGLEPAQLLGELAELRLRCCEDTYRRQAWAEALQHHDSLFELLTRLVALVPQHGDAFWGRYGELLAFLTVAIHDQVCGPQAGTCPDPLKADLAWDMAQRLAQAAPLPLQAPEWLAVLEQQLVQDGALLWCSRLESGQKLDGLERDEIHQRAFTLMARLSDLLNPAPEWITRKLNALLERQVREVLSQDPPAPAELARLLANLERLPIAAERTAPFQASLTRARLSLDLLAPELELSKAAAAAAAPQPEANDPPRPMAVVDEQPGVAEVVWLDPGDTPTALQLDLGPLLNAEFERIEEVLDGFCWHLPRGSRALPATAALVAALAPRWRAGERLEAPAFERLSCLAASWQRRLAAKLEPLPAHDWRDGLLVELDHLELDVLQPMLAAPGQLESGLAELRREHHNPAFWQQRQEVPWMTRTPMLEALRRLHVEAGFYARSHEPLESLSFWGREVSLALGDAELWTDDAGCLGRWLAVAQELARSQRGPLPELGLPPSTEQLLGELGGAEVVYVGDDAVAVLEAHRAGRCFRGQPFGLRVLESPGSRWPARPAGGFEESLALLLVRLDGLYRQRPFAVLLADCGAYRLPLLRAVHQRYGVAAISSGLPMAQWLIGSGDQTASTRSDSQRGAGPDG